VLGEVLHNSVNRWRTLPKLPGKIARWLKSRKKRSTRFIQDEPVGVKCSSKPRRENG
jgi:hypothetical protein